MRNVIRDYTLFYLVYENRDNYGSLVQRLIDTYPIRKIHDLNDIIKGVDFLFF